MASYYRPPDRQDRIEALRGLAMCVTLLVALGFSFRLFPRYAGLVWLVAVVLGFLVWVLWPRLCRQRRKKA